MFGRVDAEAGEGRGDLAEDVAGAPTASNNATVPASTGPTLAGAHSPGKGRRGHPRGGPRKRASVAPPMPLLRTLVALALAAPPTAAPPTPAPTTTTTGERVHDGPEDVASPEAAPAPDAQPSNDAAALVPEPPVAAPPQPSQQLAPASTPAPALATSEGPIDDSDELPYDPLVDSPEAIRARHWVRSGIIFMVVGGVLSIGAIAMSQATVNDPEAGSPQCRPAGDPAGNGCTRGGRQRATAALAVPGGLLLAGGVAMLTVGKLQRRRLATSLRADRRGFYLGVALRF